MEVFHSGFFIFCTVQWLSHRQQPLRTLSSSLHDKVIKTKEFEKFKLYWAKITLWQENPIHLVEMFIYPTA